MEKKMVGTEIDKKTKEDYERTIETLLERIKYLEDKVDKLKDILFDPYEE